MSQDFIILETQNNKTTIRGNPDLKNNPVSAASTFKTVLSWAALDAEIVQASTPHLTQDAHVPKSPRLITLTEAMFYSSNDYFRWLASELGHARLTRYVQQTDFFTTPVTEKWLSADFKSVERGGSLKTTPDLNHQWMIKLASGKWIQKPAVHAELEKSMAWPSSQSDTTLYGKTGTVAGAVWFNGYGKTPQGTKIVTVFISGELKDRPRAIKLFYEAFGQKWSSPL